MCGQEWCPILGICVLHLTHPSAHTHNWVVNKHTHTVNTHRARGAVGGSVPCSRVSPQSWYWELFILYTDNSCQTWDSNLQPSGYKSNSLTIRPWLPTNWFGTDYPTTPSIYYSIILLYIKYYNIVKCICFSSFVISSCLEFWWHILPHSFLLAYQDGIFHQMQDFMVITNGAFFIIWLLHGPR